MASRKSVWFLGGLLGLGVLLAAVLLAVYWMAASILEASLRPTLEKRGGELELVSVTAGLDGLELAIEGYREPGLRIDQAAIALSWSDLFQVRQRLAGRVQVASLEMDLTEREAPEKEVPQSVATLVERVAADLAGYDVSALDVEVDRLIVRSEANELEASLKLNWMQSHAGETHLAVELGGDLFELDARIKLSGDGSELGVDFIASAARWELLSERYLSKGLQSASLRGVDVYVEPVGEGPAFLDLSGYVRWTAEQPDQYSAALFADLGPVEVYMPAGEALFEKTSLGFATDGAERVRAFAKGRLESLRYGTWAPPGGEWGIKVGDHGVAAELRLAESVELSLGHRDWSALLRGEGVGDLYMSADSLDEELLQVLPLGEAASDISTTLDVTISGEYELVSGEFSLRSANLEAEIATIEWPANSVSGSDLEVRIDGQNRDGDWYFDSVDVLGRSIETYGIEANDVRFSARGAMNGEVELEPITAGILGGTILVEGTQGEIAAGKPVPIKILIESIDMERLARAVPQFKGEAEGRLSGFVLCEWTGETLRLNDGQLRIDEDSGARLSYNVDGLLTGGLNPESGAYRQYRMAEVAFQDLKLRRFQVDVFPDGDATRPIRITLYGESEQDGLLVPVDYTLNVNADDAAGLIELLKMIRRGELELN